MMIRRLILGLALCLLPTLAPAAAPHVEIKGPSVATLANSFYLDVTGTISEKPIKVRTQGPGQLTVRTWYDEKQQPGLIELTAPAPGDYWIFIIATGTIDGTADLDFAPWKVIVGGTTPGPTPPGPGPTPPPDPPTPPTPAPVTGPIYGMYVLPDNPSVGEAQLRTNTNIRAAFKANNARFSSYLLSQDVIQSAPNWVGMISAAGGPPCVLWFDSAGTLLRASKVAGEATFLDDLKALRGTK